MPALRYIPGFEFSEELAKDRNSVWNNPKMFDEKKRAEIYTVVLNSARNKFTTIPEGVLRDMLNAAMFSAGQITVDGYGMSESWSVLPLVYIIHENVTYTFNKGITKEAFFFMNSALNKYISEREKALEAEAWDAKVLALFERIKDCPHFKAAAEASRLKYNDTPLAFWRECYTFEFHSSDDECVAAVEAGTHNFMGMLPAPQQTISRSAETKTSTEASRTRQEAPVGAGAGVSVVAGATGAGAAAPQPILHQASAARAEEKKTERVYRRSRMPGTS